MHRLRALPGLLALLLVLVAACEGDGPQVSDDAGQGAAAVELGSHDGAAPAGGVETVQAGEAGEVDVHVTDAGRLELIDVRPATGWTHGLDEGGDELEIDFRHDDGRTLSVEIELEDGRLKVDLD